MENNKTKFSIVLFAQMFEWVYANLDITMTYLENIKYFIINLLKFKRMITKLLHWLILRCLCFQIKRLIAFILPVFPGVHIQLVWMRCKTKVTKFNHSYMVLNDIVFLSLKRKNSHSQSPLNNYFYISLLLTWAG